MADRTEAFVFRHVGKGFEVPAGGTVPARLIDELYERVRPKGTGGCVIVVQRMPGDGYYTVDSLTPEETRRIQDVLLFVR
jgi:hypothetical protein